MFLCDLDILQGLCHGCSFKAHLDSLQPSTKGKCCELRVQHPLMRNFAAVSPRHASCTKHSQRLSDKKCCEIIRFENEHVLGIRGHLGQDLPKIGTQMSHQQRKQRVSDLL